MIISKTGSDYKPVPAGTYIACCVRIVDLGTQISTYNGKAQRKVLFTWEIPEVEAETDDGPMPAMISTSYTASLHEKAALRKVLESWRGKPFTADELTGFDLKSVLGASCLMGVIHNEHEGTMYANVSSVMALPKGTAKVAPVHPLVNFSLDEFDEGVFEGLSPKLKEKISVTREYYRATGQEVLEDEPLANRPFAPDPVDLDDSIPF